LPGFFLSPRTVPGPGVVSVWCKDWSATTIDLHGMENKTIQVFFKTADCTLSAHFGYAYVDVNTECSSNFVGASFCPDDTVVNVTAPYGYQGYKWFDVNNNTLGTSQTLVLNPPPASGDSVYVELTPFNGFGCKDTLLAHLFDTLTVRPYAGKDTSFCSGTPVFVQLGELPKAGFVYSWSPPGGLSNPNISNPIATPTVSTQYALTVRHDGGGCYSTDTVNVNIIGLDTSLTLNGPAVSCGNSTPVTLHINPPADSLQWYQNGVPIAGANSFNYIVTQSGDYSCTLFSNAGCSFSTRVQRIDLYVKPVASFSVSSTSECFDGNIFSFTNTSSPPSGTAVYLWKFGDGNTSVNADDTHSYNATGVYTVWMYISGDGGCIDSSSVAITVKPSVKAGFKINNANQCFKNHGFVFTDTSRVTPGAGPISYNWDFGDGTTSNQQNPSHSYTTPGNYAVSLQAGVTGCTSMIAYNVNVYSSPVAAFNVNDPDQCFKGNAFSFVNSSTVFSGPLNYLWSLGDGTTSTDPDVSHIYSKAGSFRVKMKVSTPEGCSDSTYRDVVVYPNPKADFTVNNICVNLLLPLTNNTLNNTGSTLNYLWDFGNSVTSTAPNPTYSYTAPGNYSIMLQVGSAQCPTPKDTVTHSVVVDAPARGITYPVIDAVINFPEPLKARDIGTTALWLPPVNLSNNRSYKPFFEGKDPTLYRIELKTSSGCITVDTQYVKTHKKIEIYVPNVFTPGGANHYLYPACMGIAKVNYFIVYDRWGRTLFRMESDRPGWDGKIANQKQELQTVIWIIEAIDVDGNIHHRQGTTVLLR
jgi:PKD repeat protein